MMATANIKAIIDESLGVEESPWPELDRGLLKPVVLDPPRFPTELFGSFWSRWIIEAAESKSCPPDYVAAGLLASASVLIGNAVWVQAWPGWQEPPVLWLACVGNPSSGKSPGLDSALTLLRDLQTEKLSQYNAGKASFETEIEVAKVSRKKWEQEVRKAFEAGSIAPEMPLEAREPKRNSAPRMLTSDATVEAVVYRLIENPKGLLVTRDELAGWLAMMDKYGGSGGSDRAFWLEAYGGRSYAVDRVKNLDQVVNIPHTSVSIIGGIQPDRLQTLFLKGDDDGLCARFTYFWPNAIPPRRPSTIWDDGLAMLAFRNLDRLKLEVLKNGQGDAPRKFPLCEAARGLLQAFRLQNYERQKEVTGLYLSTIGKQPGLVLRLSLIFELLWACNHNPPLQIIEVSEAAMTTACAFVSAYLDPMAQRAFGTVVMSKPVQYARQIACWINKNQASSLNKRNDLLRNSQFNFSSAEDAQAALDILVDKGWVRQTAAPIKGRGRKRGDYEINPQIWMDEEYEDF